MDTVTKREIKFALYTVSMFWVAVTHNTKDNKITDINSFVGSETLDTYSNFPKEIWLSLKNPKHLDHNYPFDNPGAK